MPLPSGTLLDNTARGITKLDYAVTRRIGHELFSLHARHIASHRIAGGTRELDLSPAMALFCDSKTQSPGRVAGLAPSGPLMNASRVHGATFPSLARTRA